jgi:hypothetical protein
MTRPAHPPEVVPRLLAPVTAQPASCSSSAQALPMPADAPVTSTRLAPPPMGAPDLPAGPGSPADNTVTGIVCPALGPWDWHAEDLDLIDR